MNYINLICHKQAFYYIEGLNIIKGLSDYYFDILKKEETSDSDTELTLQERNKLLLKYIEQIEYSRHYFDVELQCVDTVKEEYTLEITLKFFHGLYEKTCKTKPFTNNSESFLNVLSLLEDDLKKEYVNYQNNKLIMNPYSSIIHSLNNSVKILESDYSSCFGMNGKDFFRYVLQSFFNCFESMVYDENTSEIEMYHFRMPNGGYELIHHFKLKENNLHQIDKESFDKEISILFERLSKLKEKYEISL